METETFTGLLPDTRPEAKKEKDYGDVELVTAAAVEWVFKNEAQIRKYPIWHQNGSGACVAFSFSKALAIEIFRITGVWVDLSPAYFYQQRADKTQAGMWTFDAAEIAVNKATTLEALMPSQNLSEAQINAVPVNKVAEAIARAIADAANSYLYLPKNMDRIAEVLDQGKGVPITIFAQNDEYLTEIPVVKNKALTYLEAPIRHKITLVDRYLHPTLGKVFVAEDSWGVGYGKGGRRIITEEFFNYRVTDPVYFSSFTLNPATTDKPKVQLSTPLEFIPLDSNGGISDLVKNEKQKEDVKKLQDVLKYEGLYPTETASTGYYGAITAKAVDKYQRRYAVAPTAELDVLQGKRAGAKTIADINKRYA